MNNLKNIIRLVISLAIPLSVGSIAGYYTTKEIDGWFSTLIKPEFNPPNWIFGPVWTALYIMMGIALYLIWTRRRDLSKRYVYGIFAVQMILNFSWSIVFFNLHEIGWALVVIIALWLAIILTIFAFRKHSKIAAGLLVPYICWVSFASILNYAIWSLN